MPNHYVMQFLIAIAASLVGTFVFFGAVAKMYGITPPPKTTS